MMLADSGEERMGIHRVIIAGGRDLGDGVEVDAVFRPTRQSANTSRVSVRK
jgi:hypothetical protein